MMRKSTIALLLLCLSLGLPSCAAETPAAPEATLPTSTAVDWPKDKLTLGTGGVPSLKVYVVEQKGVQELNIERYLEGVLAGEMKNDWPLEALKAQAILARTYALKFVADKQSRYEGADVSTDIEEAQAFDASAVNERVRQAVAETRGMALACDGELIFAWFHAHSGGMTELAKPGLDWAEAEPGYTLATQGNEPTDMTLSGLEAASAWQANFTAEEFAAAAKQQGKTVTVGGGTQLSIDKRGQSGRAETILCGDQTLDAATLRIALGSTKMRSTLLTSLRIRDGSVEMAGKGYGHGVGMSQWGAYGMANEGKTAEEIVTHYFRNVEVVKLW